MKMLNKKPIDKKLKNIIFIRHNDDKDKPKGIKELNKKG